MSKTQARELLTDLDITDFKVEELAARVEKVLALHITAQLAIGAPLVFDGDDCIACGEPWPCPTRRALDGEP